MSNFYTACQHESARECLIAAYVGVVGKFTLTLDSKEEIQPITLKKPSQETHITIGKEKRKGRSIPLISDRHFEQADLLNKINSLSPLCVAWINATYHSRDSAKLIELLGGVYATQFRVRKGTEPTVKIAIEVSVKKAIASVQGVHKITDEQIAVHMDRSRRAYRENWKDKVDHLTQLLIDLDMAILEHVCSLLKFAVYKPAIKGNIKKRNALLYTTTNCALR